MHPEAAKVLKGSIKNVREWIMQRLRVLRFNENNHNFAIELNPWNKDGYGLQSVSLKLSDKKSGESLLIPNEWKDPTIGIIAPGMLEGESELGVTDFEVDPGKSERITPLSKGGIWLDEAEKGDKSGEPPRLLPFDEFQVVAGRTHNVRVAMELLRGKGITRKRIENVLAKGVYSCSFLKGDGLPGIRAQAA